MTKIRIGIIQVLDKNKTKIIGREVEINKNWDDITTMDLKPFLEEGERIHGFCLIDKEVNNDL